MRSLLALTALVFLGAGLWLLSFEPDPGPDAVAAEPATEPLGSLFVGRQPVTPEVAEDPASSSSADHAAIPNEAILRNNQAAEELAQGQVESALRRLQELVEEYPEHDPFRHNLAEAWIHRALEHQAQGEVESAAAALERALKEHPGRSGAENLRELLRRLRTEAELEWNHWSEGSDLFELSYSTEREDILHHSQAVLDHLERCYAELAAWFASDPVREGTRGRIRVALYRRAAFGELTGLGDWAGGAFDGTVRVPVEDLVAEQARWRRILRHELVHVFVQALGGRGVPGWLNEGLAQSLEGLPRDPARLAATLRGEVFPLERLRGSLAAWSDPAAIERAYAQSLLMVERIRSEYGDETLRRMLAGCAAGQDPALSFELYTQVPLSFVLELIRR